MEIMDGSLQFHQKLKTVGDPARNGIWVCRAQRECRLSHRIKWFEHGLVDPSGSDKTGRCNGCLRGERVDGDSVSLALARSSNGQAIQRCLRCPVLKASFCWLIGRKRRSWWELRV